MVRVNFRMCNEVEEEYILQFFKNIGYEQIGINNRSINIEGDIIFTYVFIRNTKYGRYHIHLAFGRKYSGPIKYPQIKVYAHFDIIKVVKGKERHFACKNEHRILGEIYQISKKLKTAKLGHLEYKDLNCAHATLHLKYKEKLLKYINRKKYKKYDRGKYRKKLKNSQYTLGLSEQEHFIHLVCVHAEYNGNSHNLIKSKAIMELNNIIRYATS